MIKETQAYLPENGSSCQVLKEAYIGASIIPRR
jgi:hypothetical protein